MVLCEVKNSPMMSDRNLHFWLNDNKHPGESNLVLTLRSVRLVFQIRDLAFVGF
jgi:hypothetical protein